MAAPKPGGRRPTDLISTDPAFIPGKNGVFARAVRDPLDGRTLGGIGVSLRVTGKGRFPPSYLRIAYEPDEVPWIEPRTLRLFFSPAGKRSYRPVWRSGLCIGLGYLWARIEQPGTYVAVGLPRDRLLLEALRQVALRRRIDDPGAEEGRGLLVEALHGFAEEAEGRIDELRDRLSISEFTAATDRARQFATRRGQGFGIVAELLPCGFETFKELTAFVEGLEPFPEGFPEEELFFPPRGPQPLPWPPEPPTIEFPWPPPWDPDIFLPPIFDWRRLLCLLWARDWPMYMRDGQHTGRAICSNIDSSTVSSLTERHDITLDGRIVSQPAIVGGRVYLGTMDASALTAGGFLYKINLATGATEGTFGVSTRAGRHGTGIASTPALVGGKIYLSSLSGHLYRIDAGTMTQDWVVDLRAQDLAHKQPVTNSSNLAAGWSSPVVADKRVYVGHGEGETGGHGYIFCVDANTGDVIWLFCTNKFTNPNAAGSENQPNVLPPADWAGPGAPPAPYALAPNNPSHRGSSPWSSLAYDPGLKRVYIGTGNASPDDPLPDPRYASGMISLDAVTGQFAGFFQPAASDSYRPTADFDVDVPGAATIFTRDRQRLVGFGSKNGSYFLLKADGLGLVERRQLLPYDSAGNPFPAVDPPNNNNLRENKSGVFGTAAVDADRKRLFVGLGGYSRAIDNVTTPFVRAMKWSNLNDAWPTAGTNPPKYSLAQPPVYSTAGETGLTNVASVNDVIFVGTTKPGLYALDADTGFCLWSAGWSAVFGRYCFGAAVSGSYVAAGNHDHLFIYSL